MNADKKVTERRLRRALDRRGMTLMRSHARDPAALGFGGYAIVDLDGAILAGEGFTLSLGEAEAWLDRSAGVPTPGIKVLTGNSIDQLRRFSDDHFDCCITSLPSWSLRDTDHRQIDSEEAPYDYMKWLVEACAEVRRVLKPTGTMFLNIGDNLSTRRAIWRDSRRIEHKEIETDANSQAPWRESAAPGLSLGSSRLRHAGTKEKDLLLNPFEFARTLRADGWFLRAHITWIQTHDAACALKDRSKPPSGSVLLLTKRASGYYYDRQPETETDAWEIVPSMSDTGHTSMMPLELARRCIEAGSPPGGLVVDPFGGRATVALAARSCGRSAVVIELNPLYAKQAKARLQGNR